ncbi:hypothetical protein ACFP1Z_20735 [Streptomyces gamaensis]|uniref:Uncharacterized protein n=1 Tax=Streptomyces gamaensis TaxID=1763542 RepID=A0ABW0Z525_9ACTN
MPVAHALLAVAVGALLGLALRRTVPAMFATLVVFGGLTLFLRELRPYLIGPVTKYDALLVLPDRDGDEWDYKQGTAGTSVDTHPVGHLWPLQWAETGLVLGLTAVAAAAAVWCMRRTRR